MLKIGRYMIAFGRYLWFQTRGPTSVREAQQEFVGVVATKEGTKCECGAISYWWDGEKSLCSECLVAKLGRT